MSIPEVVVLQPLWDHILVYSDIVSSPLFNIAMPVGWYITLCLIFTALDFHPGVQRYKIQQQKPGTPLTYFPFQLSQ